MDWDSEWLLDWSLWSLKGIEGLDEGWSLIPGKIGGLLDDVVSLPS